MRSVKPTRRVHPSRRPHYRPQLVTLEERLPLGDGVLGLLVGAALLPPHAGSPAVVQPAPQASGERGVSTPRLQAVTGGFTPPARPDEAWTVVLAGVQAAAPDWEPLTDPFTAARRRFDTFPTSPPREQGPDASPSLALRAGEGAAPLPARGGAPAFVAAGAHPDSALLMTLAALYQPEAPARAADATPAQEAQVQEHFGKLPLYFEENVGQTDASVHFFTRGPGYGLYLTSTEAVMVLQPPRATAGGGMLSRPCGDSLRVPDCVGRESMAPAATTQDTPEPPAVIRMSFVGANATPAVTGRAEQPGKVNYFLGNDPTKWHTNIATFGRVEYDEVYPGIDLVWHGSQRQLEYDFVVAAGADPAAIRLRFAHADRIEIDARGDLVLHAGGQELRQHRPLVYQAAGDARQEVASRFVLEGQQVSFALGAYDASRPLVIDPVLSYSTYLGGSGYDSGSALAVDPASGDALVTGLTLSPNFPTANPLYASNRGGVDVFVTRLNAAGSALVFSTYLGGSSADFGTALVVDPASGDALLTGDTYSTDFPTANPLQPVHGGGGLDAFVTRISSSPVAYYYVYPDSGQVTAGVPFDLYVFALDAQFNVVPDYTGLILFYALDPLATTPVYHQFQRAERGIASFPNGLTFRTVGVQELYVFNWPGVQAFGYAAFQVTG